MGGGGGGLVFHTHFVVFKAILAIFHPSIHVTL